MEDYFPPLSKEKLGAIKQLVYRLWPASSPTGALKRETALILLEDPDQRLRISHVEALLSIRLPQFGTVKHSVALQNVLSDPANKRYFVIDQKVLEPEWGMQLLRLNTYEFFTDSSFSISSSAALRIGQFPQDASAKSTQSLGSSPMAIAASALAIPPSTPTQSKSNSLSFPGTDLPSSPVSYKLPLPDSTSALRASFTSGTPLFSPSAGKGSLLSAPLTSTWGGVGAGISANPIVGSLECGSAGSSLGGSLRYGGLSAGSFFPSPVVDIPSKPTETPKDVASIWGMSVTDTAWSEPAIGSSWHSVGCGSPEMDGLQLPNNNVEDPWKGVVVAGGAANNSAADQEISNGGSSSSNEEADDPHSNCMDIESAIEAIIELDSRDLVASAASAAMSQTMMITANNSAATSFNNNNNNNNPGNGVDATGACLTAGPSFSAENDAALPLTTAAAAAAVVSAGNGLMGQSISLGGLSGAGSFGGVGSLGGANGGLSLRSGGGMKPGSLTDMESAHHFLESFNAVAKSAGSGISHSFSVISSHACKPSPSSADSFTSYNVGLSWNSMSPVTHPSWSAMAAREPFNGRSNNLDSGNNGNVTRLGSSAPSVPMKPFVPMQPPPPPAQNPTPQLLKPPQQQQPQPQSGNSSFGGLAGMKADAKLMAKLPVRVRMEIQHLVKQVPGLKFDDFDEGVLFQLSLKREEEALAALRTLSVEDVTGIQHMAAYINHVIKNFHLAPAGGGSNNIVAASLPSATVRANSTPVSSKAILQKLPLRVYKKLEEIISKCNYMEWKHFDAGVVKVLAQLAEISEDDVAEELDMLKGTDLSNVEYMPAYLNKRLNNKLWSRRKMMLSAAS